jgi:crotonobetainyl-CoA:carnitine CoA-transferase CaiB-like acyl-CoA transferase
MVPFQNFEAADGWIVVACPKQALWERLVKAIGEPQLLDDERFASFAARDANRAALLAVLEPRFRSTTVAGWIEILGAAGVPCGPVNDIAAALEDPQVLARNGVLETRHPELGTVRGAASPLRIDGFAPPAERGPYRGENTAAILRELCGYGDERLAQLAGAGVFGDVLLDNDQTGGRG